MVEKTKDIQITNTLADSVVGIINALIGGGEDAAELYLTSLDPILMADPFMKFLVDEGVDWLGGLIDNFLAKGAAAAVIDIQANGENSELVTATTALQFAEASGNQEAINAAVQTAANAYRKLINSDGNAVIPGA